MKFFKNQIKKTFTIIIIASFIYACSPTNIKKDTTRYFDQNNKEISQYKFNDKLSSLQYLEIPGDSLHHKKLTLRKISGKITNRAMIESLLEKETNQKIDSNKPLVIIYHPGKDECNSSNSSNFNQRKLWHTQLEVGLNEISQTKPIYIYKNKEGLEKYIGIMNWHKDPKETIERLFFKYPYPCKSVVIISKEGNYVSYFGEFSKESVWEFTKLMMDK